MEWINLSEETSIETIKKLSSEHPVLIFKHSTRCSISSAALSRLERNWDMEKMSHVKAYYLDLLSYRNISNQIAESFNVHHESPQVLLIKDGECIYHASHMGITFAELAKKC
ncbi:MAG TPA: bacillithiol system redox-active protein YtxJ [Cytophagaceae bacterium]